MRVAVLGFGLIGGSIARALREGSGSSWEIVAWSPSGTGPARAAREGVVDHLAGSPAEAVEGAELIVLAAPPLDCLALLYRIAGPLRTSLAPGAVITDVASTKTVLVQQAARLGLRFVGGHPMAGRETTGYAAAVADLFVGRPWVIVPAGDPAAEERVALLARACRALPVTLAAAEHDEAVAAISHLPLVLSVALVEAVVGTDISGDRSGWPEAAPLAAGGWEGMTRLARGDPEMAAGIAATNAGPLAARIRDLRRVLDEWLDLLEGDAGPDAARLAERFRAARQRAGGES
jgi:prephenate dehydrogenase